MTTKNIEGKFTGDYDYDMDIINETMNSVRVLYFNNVISTKEFEKIYSEMCVIKRKYGKKEGL